MVGDRPVRGWATSTLDAYSSEDWTTDAPEIEAVCAAYRRGNRRALVFDAADFDQVLDGLTTLANTEGERGEDRTERKRDPEGALFARLASRGLSAVSVRGCRTSRRPDHQGASCRL